MVVTGANSLVFLIAKRVQEVLDTFAVAAELGPESLGAYVISMCATPSDISLQIFLNRITTLPSRYDIYTSLIKYTYCWWIYFREKWERRQLCEWYPSSRQSQICAAPRPLCVNSSVFLTITNASSENRYRLVLGGGGWVCIVE